jgi:hypothetical protein
MAPLIMALAQPTPACTVMASAGQFKAQAPHSMQASLSVTTAFLSLKCSHLSLCVRWVAACGVTQIFKAEGYAGDKISANSVMGSSVFKNTRDMITPYIR